ncbi:MAG: tetratricopeptide repeat protein [Bacteroidales bacterium]|nr:tetratricopeptide repeat protein [Bacteroidales bacterium]
MKNIIISFIFLLFISFFGGLSGNTISNKNLSDSAFINDNIDKAFYFAFNKPDSALYYIDEAIKLSAKTNYKNGLSDGFHTKGIIYYAIDKYDSALNNYFVALDMRKELNDKKKYASTLNNIALTYSNLSLYEPAVKFNLEALKIRESLGDSIEIAKSLNNLGMCYHYLKDYENALNFYSQSLHIKTLQGDNKVIASTLNNIGQLYFDWGFEKKKYFDSAFYYLSKAVILRNLSGDTQGMAESLLNLGNIYIQREEYSKALIFLEDANHHFNNNGDLSGMANVEFNLGYIFYKRLNPDYKTALDHFEKSVKIAREINDLNLLEDNYYNISAIYRLMKKFDYAYNYVELYNEIKDSISSIETRKEIARLQIAYETEKKEKQIFNQGLTIDKLKENQNKLIFSVIALLIIVMSVFIILYRKKRLA